MTKFEALCSPPKLTELRRGGRKTEDDAKEVAKKLFECSTDFEANGFMYGLATGDDSDIWNRREPFQFEPHKLSNG